MTALLPLSPDPVVAHGDYSLDNTLLVGDRVSGMIDLDRVGIADRYQDLAIILDCLAKLDPELVRHFFAAYGIAEPDARKMPFYLCLDEMF